MCHLNLELTRLKTKDRPDLGISIGPTHWAISILADHESMIKESAATFSKRR